MTDFVVDLLVPKTDRLVVVEFIVMGVVWTVLVALSFRWRPEYRTFVIGLAVLNLAWFGARAIH